MNTKVTIAGVELKNPVMTASGTFGSGAEYSEFYDLGALGAVVTKGVANVPWPGNPTPRIAETRSGMLNAIGLQNPGIDVFVKRDIPFLKKYDTKVVVNVCGKTTEDYIDVVERLGDEPVDMLEINISCPNVKEGGIAFGQDPKAVEAITKAVKAHAKQPVVMKLSPNVTDITVMAKAAEAGIVCCFHPNSAKNSLFRTEEDYEAMFELIQPTAIGWAPDVGHIENGGMSAIEQMKAHRDLIRHVHFKDRIAQNEWAVMGEGKIDYPAIIKYLAETGYLGWIMVEDESPRAETDSDGVVAEDGKYMCRQIHR